MRDQMQPGDGVLFHHSSADPPGVAGLAKIVRSGYPDPTARDPDSKYFDPKAGDDDPRWYMVDIEFEERFPEIVSLGTLRETPGLEEMPGDQQKSAVGATGHIPSSSGSCGSWGGASSSQEARISRIPKLARPFSGVGGLGCRRLGRSGGCALAGRQRKLYPR